MTRALHRQTRIGGVVGALASIAAGLAVRATLHGFFAKYGGDALWSCVVYALVVFVRPTISVRRAAATTLAISYAVELAQITPGPAWLSSKSALLRMVFGAVFSPYDLVAYTVGVSLACGAHAIARR